MYTKAQLIDSKVVAEPLRCSVLLGKVLQHQHVLGCISIQHPLPFGSNMRVTGGKGQGLRLPSRAPTTSHPRGHKLQNKHQQGIGEALDPQSGHKRPQVGHGTGHLVPRERGRHLLNDPVQVEVHHPATKRVGGERGVDQVVVGGGCLGDVGHNDINDKEAEPGEEVEAEEDDVAGGWGLEHEGEDVHPRGYGHSIGHQEEDKAR